MKEYLLEQYKSNVKCEINDLWDSNSQLFIMCDYVVFEQSTSKKKWWNISPPKTYKDYKNDLDMTTFSSLCQHNQLDDQQKKCQHEDIWLFVVAQPNW